MNIGSKVFALLTAPFIILLLFVAAEKHPAYFTNVTLLGGALLLEVIFVTVWHYEKWFFVVLMLTFLWAGTALPMAGTGAAVRWVFLLVGALVGIVKWAENDRRKPFKPIHLLALLCVLAAVVSSMVSHHSQMSLLKSASLCFLFLYGACGARVAIAGRETSFFQGLLKACEVVSYVSALCYGVLHFQLFGNPNSLGAVMGVVVVPVLLWGVLITEDRHVRHRLTFALCLASYLLYYSISRAAILACLLTVTVMCIALRRQALLIRGAFILVFLAAVVAVVQPGHFDALVTSFTEDVIYKGKAEQGLLGSRRSPWQETFDVIKESPWFGSGFGTDIKQLPPAGGGLVFSTAEGLVREHGNSYLALLEFVGMLGIVPFAILLLMVMRQVLRGCQYMWRTGNVRHFAVPLVLICMAGLIHAFFEDWLFAVGYYLNVFFWICVFLLCDLQPAARVQEGVPLRTARSQAPLSAGQVPLSASQ